MRAPSLSITGQNIGTIIIAVDCLYTPMPIDEGKTRKEIEAEIFEEFKRKMAKWKNKSKRERMLH